MSRAKDKTPPGGSAERIIAAAMALFGEHGFHGVTTRQIAAASNLNMATVHHHVGTKGELYRKVIERLHDEELELVAGFTAELEGALLEDMEHVRDLMMRMVDALVDLCYRNPARAPLYIRRWLRAPDDLSGAESEHSLRLFELLLGVLRRAQDAGVIHAHIDLKMLLRSFDWLVYGYFVSGPVEENTWRGDPRAPENIDAFKAYLHAYLSRMLGLEEEHRSGDSAAARD